MPHPNGGSGNTFSPCFSFQQAYDHVGSKGVIFKSTTNECIYAKQGKTNKGLMTIVFVGEKTTHGNVCEKCWGYRNNCSGTHIGQCSEGLDNAINSKT